MSTRFQKISERMRREGLLGIARVIAYRLVRTVCKIYVVRVYERPTTKQRVAIADDRFSYRALDAAAVREWAGRADGLLPANLAQRIEAGVSSCVAAFDRDSDRLAGFVWIARPGFPPEWIYGPHAVISEDVAYLYNAVTLGPFRGQRLFSRLVDRAFEQLKSEGVETVFLTVEIDNTASQRAVRNAGFRSLGTHVSWGMPYGTTLCRSRLDLPFASRPEFVLAESDRVVDVGSVEGQQANADAQT